MPAVVAIPQIVEDLLCKFWNFVNRNRTISRRIKRSILRIFFTPLSTEHATHPALLSAADRGFEQDRRSFLWIRMLYLLRGATRRAL